MFKILVILVFLSSSIQNDLFYKNSGIFSIANGLIKTKILSNNPAGIVIESKKLTNWGKWNDWSYCPNGSYVTGFQLKVEQSQRNGDDTALNQIALSCKTPQGKFTLQITSGIGPYGDWGEKFHCPENSMGVGFELRSEKNKRLGDDTATNNFGLVCQKNGQKVPIDGNGLEFGHWTGFRLCPEAHVLCGIQEQIEPNKGKNRDDTALNNIKMHCCPVPHPAQNCTPIEAWIEIFHHDNTNGQNIANISYNFDSKIGILYSPLLLSNNAVQFTQNLFTLEKASEILQPIFTTNGAYNWNSNVNISWTKVSPKIWNVTEKFKGKNFFEIESGFTTEIYQAVGFCSFFDVRLNEFKRIDKKPKGFSIISYFKIN